MKLYNLKTNDGVRNYNISAKKQGSTLVFLRKIVRGAADNSYGIEVAKLAGIPEGILRKAREYLEELEEGRNYTPYVEDQISFADVGSDEIRQILEATDINSLTPLEAINLLNDLKEKIR